MRVLIVEDSQDVADMLGILCEGEGHRTRVVSHLEEAVQVTLEYRPHLVLTDFILPKGDGIRVLCELKKIDRDVLVVLITGYGGEKVAVEALRHGASNYLNKPINSDYLKQLLHRYHRIVEGRENAQRICSHITSTSVAVRIPNETPLITPLVEHLLRSVREIHQEADISGLHLGLEEMIRNAIEHGNLGIGFEEKSDALANCALQKLMAERLAIPQFAARRVTVDLTLTGDLFRCVVQDEGEGFDYRRQEHYNPLAPEALDRLNGRGIFLTRAFFDELNYEGCGNRVEMLKRITHEA
ncbi:MAG: response regulator [Sumerlaeia bacterium]